MCSKYVPEARENGLSKSTRASVHFLAVCYLMKDNYGHPILRIRILSWFTVLIPKYIMVNISGR